MNLKVSLLNPEKKTPLAPPREQISFKNVEKTYPNGTQALKGVSLQITSGDFVFLIGSSGAGKSTLVKLLIREETATGGNLFVAGLDLGKLKNRHLPLLRRKYGIVFQDYKLLTNSNVYQNVAFSLRVVEPGAPRMKERVEEVLALVGLSHKLDKYPTELSGGEQQRIAIARALVHNPLIFLADEPTGNLDPDTTWEIVNLIKEINKMGTTVIMATHNKDIVNKVNRRVIAIEGGEIVRDVEHGSYSDNDNNETQNGENFQGKRSDFRAGSIQEKFNSLGSRKTASDIHLNQEDN